jgi:hypothetical protein
MALKQNFSMFSGNDVTLEVELTDVQGSPETPLILIGTQELIFAIGRRGATEPLVTKTLDDGITITDAANGMIEILLSAAEMEPLVGIFQHELRITNQQGNKATLMYGLVEVMGNMIRS